MGLLTRHQPDKNGFITLEAKSPHGHPHLFTAKPAADDTYAIYVQKDDTQVRVLCSPQLNKPLTADYDLMIVAPRTEDFGSLDIPHNPDVSADAFAKNDLICCAAGRQKRLSTKNYWREKIPASVITHRESPL